MICGRKEVGPASGSTYAFCRHEPDPDNPKGHNFANPHVLDGSITRLNGDKCCDSCLHEYDWMPDCKFKHLNPRRKNMYDHTLEWVPFLNTQPPVGSTTFFYYTIFTTAESAACQFHNCNEAAIYRNMPLHLATKRTLAWDNSIDFLPGTQFSYQIPVPSYLSSPLYGNVLGFVAMNADPQYISPDMQVPSLDRMFAEHATRLV